MSDQSKPSNPPYSDETQHEAIDWNLTNHTPNEHQIACIEELREAAKTVSHLIVELCPPGPDRTLALQGIESGLMMAVASIARIRPA